MLRRFRIFIGLNARSASAKRLLNANISRHPTLRVDSAMLDSANEIAVYIHRFHNLDLFQQGWYQIKISMRWEDSSYGPPGIPARVVQYEAPDLGSDDIFTVWRIDDADHSFSTQPFRIKYARQDVLLSMMVSFNFARGKDESTPKSAVMLKFELLYTPVLENGADLQETLDSFPAAVHELRIPSKALLGLHSYCPIHFDAFHAVLVDLSIHILLRNSAGITSKKVPRLEDVADENSDGSNQASGGSAYVGPREISLMIELSASRDFLLEELQKISKGIEQPIDDLVDANFNLSSEISDRRIGITELEGLSPSSSEKSKGRIDVGSNRMRLQSLSKEDLLEAFHALSNELTFLWNIFLKYHRINRIRIIEYLHDLWAKDRRAEWSIWMVHSRVEIPYRNLGGVDDAAHYAILGKVSLHRKSSEDPAQIANARADLHRRSIAQMKINNRSIQDMHIFGDPSHVPVILIEHVSVVPEKSTGSGKSFFGSFGQKEAAVVPIGPEAKLVPKLSVTGPRKNGRLLTVVVFVHGFQGHHLDLRLVRNQWLLIDSGAECFMSEANEEKTSGDFREMGGRLAEEVSTFLKKKMDKASRHGGYRDIKISFVGHSIGNIIIRSSLTEAVMEPYLKYLYTYMSISGPHLGYLYSSNSLFNSGLWLLKKLKGTQCIHQLTFTDDADIQNTFFYKLCKQKTLENFKNIILLSSPQDGYVPYHSARIEYCQAAALDSKKGAIFTEMLSNCLAQIYAPSSEGRTFMRCDVNFDTSTQGRSLNTIIGRAAHIEFLETDIFARFIMWSFSDLFV